VHLLERHFTPRNQEKLLLPNRKDGTVVTETSADDMSVVCAAVWEQQTSQTHRPGARNDACSSSSSSSESGVYLEAMAQAELNPSAAAPTPLPLPTLEVLEASGFVQLLVLAASLSKKSDACNSVLLRCLGSRYSDSESFCRHAIKYGVIKVVVGLMHVNNSNFREATHFFAKCLRSEVTGANLHSLCSLLPFAFWFSPFFLLLVLSFSFSFSFLFWKM
jgi:hypothetical protein